MIPILYEETETAFTSNGLGGLPDALYCRVTEQRNGIYELEMLYPVSGIHYADILLNRIIYAPHDDTKVREPFDIYRISKEINGKVLVNARHVSYRLAKIPVEPFTAGSCTAALLGLETHAAVTSPFTFWTDKAVTADFSVDVPTATRSLLAGQEGSILDVYGTGEYEFNKFVVKLHLHRGANNGVTIQYGKNLKTITDDTDGGDSYTGVYPYYYSDIYGLITLPEKVVYATPHDDRAIPFDTSDYFGDTAPTENELRTYAQNFIDAHAGKISNSIKISFVQLWQTEEFKSVASLQRVKLCDTVTVKHPILGISTTTQVVEVVYDALRERYDTMTLSEPTTTINDAISAEISIDTKTLAQKSFVSSAIATATLLIQGGLGGHVVINTDGSGYPSEILIMDTDDKNTAVNVIRMNMAGIGFSKTGYSGTYDTAWTLDGHFVADWIDTGTLTANLMKVGVLTDQFGRFFLDLDSGEFRFNASGAQMNGTAVATSDEVAAARQLVADLQNGDVAANQTAINEILNWITFDVLNGLRIGSDDTGYSVQITNNEIGFFNGGTRMAYISNQMLFIGDVQVQKSLQFGISSPEWAFVPRTNGNLSFRYIGA